MDIDFIIEHKEITEELANHLTKSDIDFLIPLLDEKNNEVRYIAFLILSKRSELANDIFPYWNVFVKKLESNNSYQRSIGIMMIAVNIRWDGDKKFDSIFESYMSHCHDEKFITSRQTIQNIEKWIKYTPEHLEKVIDILFAIDVNSFKDSQKKLILVDILHALLAINHVKRFKKIDHYFLSTLTGEILDKKTKKQLEKYFMN